MAAITPSNISTPPATTIAATITTEDQLLRLLADTHLAAEGPRRQAEQHLAHAQRNPAFPVSLAAIGSHSSVTVEIRQSALLLLRTWVENFWNAEDQDDTASMGLVSLDNGCKDQLRRGMLELATSGDADRKIRAAASYVVTKIANVDFPDQWPNLLPTLLHLIPNATDLQLHGSLKVLSDLVEDALSEDQFFSVARDILKVVYDVAVNQTRKHILRAVAISIFRSTFDIMDMVKDEHGPEVKAFADESLTAWSPLFMDVMKMPLPTGMKMGSNDGDENNGEAAAARLEELYRGIVALKLQVVKTLMKVRLIFPQLLLSQYTILFSATWAELSLLQEDFQQMYVENDEQGRLEDADGLPYTLDFLVLEELDFLQSCIRTPPVQMELEAQIQQHAGVVHNTPWVIDVMKLAVVYAQIIKEEEDLWDVDVNLFLAEETSVTANYTARSACGDLLIKLGEWLHQGALQGLLTYTQILFPAETSTWRSREASLFLLTQLMNDFLDIDRKVAPEVAGAYLELIEYAINRKDEPLLRARGYLVAGTLVQSVPSISATLFERVIRGVNGDESDVVKVACIKSIQGFIKVNQKVQPQHQHMVLHAISEYLYSKDLTEFEDADDLLVTLEETLRAAIKVDPHVVVSGNSAALDLLFTLAKHGASNFQMTMLVTETFEEIVQYLTGTNLHTQLCAKVLPSLTGAFDLGNMTGDNPLVELATDLLAILTENGQEPLPPGYIAAALPKLHRLLMATTDGGILRPGAAAVKFMLMHDHQQVFAWHDEQNKSGLEVCLIIIDKLLSPSIEDNAASEVGGLAAELVEKAGPERLGPYLEQLLRAVASRLDSAAAAPFIQSLILVFARLSLTGAQDVVDFLSQIDINGQNGLQVVMSKWLENSINFAGYDEIRQNVIALSKLYSLNDARLVKTMVRGDQILPHNDVIVTRSRAKLHPVEYNIIPAPLKILKVLIQELLSASGQFVSSLVTAVDDETDKDDWEDVLDLGSAAAKADLMAYAEAGSSRQRERDDETQAYLSDFFIAAAREDRAGFATWFSGLEMEEKNKLEGLATVGAA